MTEMEKMENLADFDCLCNTADRKELYMYLDSFHFVNRQEVVGAVCDFFRELNDYGDDISYGELALCSELAEKYIADNDLEDLID